MDALNREAKIKGITCGGNREGHTQHPEAHTARWPRACVAQLPGVLFLAPQRAEGLCRLPGLAGNSRPWRDVNVPFCKMGTGVPASKTAAGTVVSTGPAARFLQLTWVKGPGLLSALPASAHSRCSVSGSASQDLLPFERVPQTSVHWKLNSQVHTFLVFGSGTP